MRYNRPESIAQIAGKDRGASILSYKPVYHGVRFRSMLEARFAWHLDDLAIKWVYEPRVFGPKGRRYLPDFQLIEADQPTYVEVKPILAMVKPAQEKMTVIWDEQPTAVLVLVVAQERRWFAASVDRPWETWQERWAA